MISADNQTLEFHETNAALDYATHNYFRYFGKLPPVVVRYILKEGLANAKIPLFLDLMCGSGTGLVEARLLGIPAVGVDVNPLSVLISKVKTTFLSPAILRRYFEQLQVDILSDLNYLSLQPTLPGLLTTKNGNERAPDYLETEMPCFSNRDYWFAPAVRQALTVIRHHVDQIDTLEVRDFFRVAFLSIIRRVSNASPRIGRIFYIGQERQVDTFAVFVNKCLAMMQSMAELEKQGQEVKIKVIEADARATGLPNENFGFILNHPPYFALYKYSSDVLRFELEWGGYNRSDISQREIRDGFKTTRLDTFEEYIADMIGVFTEAYRLLQTGCLFCVVVNNSTLRDVRLPVVDRLTTVAEQIGFKLDNHFCRNVRYAQASYHRSAREDKKVSEDYILFFLK
jgi:site-specific DNA-methyltransferase (cytosine-N4-specific)